jgi:hypothetical protein
LNLHDKDDSQGEGGHVVLAMMGNWVVAEFVNGTILRAPHLNLIFLADNSTATSSADHDNSHTCSSGGLAWCLQLPSDEWHCPFLEK